jgi:preprotein translocase subunit SecY
MAVTRSLGTGALGGLGQLSELRQRAFFLLGALIVFRITTHIPVPGINPIALAQLFDEQRGTILDMFNMFSGGALERFSIVALGIMPYISASIIVQLLTAVHPTLEQLKKEGESGRRKLTQYTRYGTVGLAIFQALGMAIAIEGQQAASQALVLNPGIGFRVTAVTTLVTGTLFLMWLGEQITERGIGNGISMIIFAGIVAGLPSAVGGSLELARIGELHYITLVLLFCLVLAVTAVVVYVERGQRRITVNYAKRQVGRRTYGGQTSHLPLKINMSGVIPPIFASSLILFPSTLGSWFGSTQGMGWLADVANAISPGQPLYVILYTGGIIFFCFFYTGKPKEVGGLGPGHSAGRSDRALYRWGDDALDAGWRGLRVARLLASGVFNPEVQCAFLFRRDLLTHHRRRGDGLHGPSAVSFDVPPV